MKEKYSGSFKSQALEKAMLRGPSVTIQSFCDKRGVSQSALTSWIRNAKEQTLMTDKYDTIHLPTLLG